MNRADRRALARTGRQANAGTRRLPRPDGAEQRATDTLKPGDIVIGTLAGDTYPTPRTLAALDHAPEHSQRTTAYRLTWHGDHNSQVYYGDTELWVLP